MKTTNKKLTRKLKEQKVLNGLKRMIREQKLNEVESGEQYRVSRIQGSHGWEVAKYKDKKVADKVAAFLTKLIEYESNYDPQYPSRYEVKSGW